MKIKGIKKLRVWVPDIERMYQVKSIDVQVKDGEQRYVNVWEHPCARSAMIKNKVGKFRLGDGVEVMQSTGLKDKNGVEIYEGDIIDSKHKLQVLYQRDSFVVESKWNMNDSIRLSNYLDKRYIAGCSPEIIGNIYENKELLK